MAFVPWMKVSAGALDVALVLELKPEIQKGRREKKC